jgi:serine/threonine-protein kinase SRPK3
MIDEEFEIHGVRYPIVRSQPIPHPFKWNDPGMVVEQYMVCLTDFGHSIHFLFTMPSTSGLHGVSVAQWANRELTMRIICPHALRAPEVILGADFDMKVDIWSLGCMVSLIKQLEASPQLMYCVRSADF